jgi:hypothetical protein
MMNRALNNTLAFVIAYIVLMLPTYLAYIDANTPLLHIMHTEGDGLFNFPMIVHAAFMVALCWLCHVRGMLVGKRWLIVLPIIATAFEFIPALIAIPFIPTAYHLLAIIIGATSTTNETPLHA